MIGCGKKEIGRAIDWDALGEPDFRGRSDRFYLKVFVDFCLKM